MQQGDARSNVGWSWGLQEVVKWTCPNFSDDLVNVVMLASAQRGTEGARAIATT